MEMTGEQDIDGLLIPLGGFGKFQILNICFLSTFILLCSFSELGFILTAADLKHRCQITECEGADAEFALNADWSTAAFPSDSGSCLRNQITSNISCSAETFNNLSYECSSFIYETTEWTVPREDWGLHCDSQRYLINLIGSLNNAGQVIGALYIGYLSDRFGRKVVVTLGLIVAVIGIIKSFSINFAMMITLETMEASIAVALFNIPYVLAMEMVDPSKRVLAATIISSAYTLGEVILGLVQYLTYDWRNTLRICYAPCLLFVLYYWAIPESVRWLLNSKRPDEAFGILKGVAKMNGKDVSDEMIKNVIAYEMKTGAQQSHGQGANQNLKEMWHSKIMRTRVLACLFVWLCSVFVFFGLTMSSVSISDDKFLNFILNALIELPGYVVCALVIDRIGRRLTLSTSLFICGIACILDAFTPNGDSWGWARLTLFLIGKLGGTLAFYGIDIYTTEMFPTSIRSTMMSVGLMTGKLITILAPQVPLLADLYEPLPLLVFGVAAFASGIVSTTFPETLNCKLPDTIEEAENLGRKKVLN